MGIGPDPEWMFDLTGTVIPIFLIVVIGIIVVTAGRGIFQWSRNNSSAVQTVPARIVSKRSEVRQRQFQDDAPFSKTTTTYFLTYETAGGTRMEFKVDGSEYGMSVEGDRGMLTYQGTRYHGFERLPGYLTAK